MEIFCACPFAVAALGWEPAPGRRSLSLCVKATFVLAPGAPAVVSPLQDPIRADDGAAAPDLVPVKPRVDVLFTGHAHAPGGAPIDSLIARARLGAFRKSLSINGDRAWVPSFEGLRPSAAVPFRSMPLTYDRAVRTGENLAGVDISQGAEPNRPLANIAAIAEQGGETPGLGPIPLGWRALRHGMGEPALLWATRAGLGLGPPPAGFDFRVFNAAPAEQQLDDLPPGAGIVLENLHPEHPVLSARLSTLRVKVFRRPPGSDECAEQPARCDTLWIDTDRGLAIAIWRSAVLLEGADDESVGRLVVVAETEGERIGPEEVDRMLARFAPEATYVDPGLLRGAPPSLSFPDIPDPIPVPAPPALLAADAPSVDSGPADEPTPPTRDDAGDRVAVQPAEAEAPARPITLAPPANAETSAVQPLPFRAPPTGFEDMRATGATSGYPPPPGAAAQHDDDDEQTPPRGYPALSAVRAVPAPAPSTPWATSPTTPETPSALSRYGTTRPEPPAGAAYPPPPAVLHGAYPPPPPAFSATYPPAPPLPAAAQRAPSGPALDGPGAHDLYCAARMDAWQSDAPLGEALARRGVDEAAFRAHEASVLEALGREGAAGESATAVAVLEGLLTAGESWRGMG